MTHPSKPKSAAGAVDHSPPPDVAADTTAVDDSAIPQEPEPPGSLLMDEDDQADAVLSSFLGNDGDEPAPRLDSISVPTASYDEQDADWIE